MIEKVKRFFLRHEYLIWAVCLGALLRLPSLLEPYWYGDEGIYLTLGQGIRNGLQLYRDIHDNKPPVIYFMAAVTGSVFWFRFLLLVWNSIAIVLFSKLSAIILDPMHTKKPFRILGIEFPPLYPSVYATLLFAFAPFFVEGNIANGEIFMIMPTVAAMLVLSYRYFSKYQRPHPYVLDALAGIFFSVAFLTKVPALFDAAAAGVTWYVFAFLDTVTLSVQSIFQAIKKILKHAPTYVFVASFALPVVATIIYYSFLGVGEHYMRAAFLQNVGYLSSWKTGSHQAGNLAQSGIMNRAIALLAVTVFFLLTSRWYTKKSLFLFLWFSYALFGALLSERPYPHYLIQVIPPTILLIVHALNTVFSIKEHKTRPRSPLLVLCTTFVAIIVLIVSIRSLRFWYYPVLPYYSNYAAWITGQKTKDQYLSFFDQRLPQLYSTAEKIIQKTSPDERIFIWGDLPSLYALTRRLPPGRYTSSYHIKDFHGEEETLQAIEQKRPKLIIVDTLYEPPFLPLQELLSSNYIVIDSTTSLAIYRIRTGVLR